MVNPPPRNTWDTLAYGLQGMSQAMNNFANALQTQQSALQESHDREMCMAYALATSQRDLQWMLQVGASQTPAGSTAGGPNTEHHEHAEEHHEHADEEDRDDEQHQADTGGPNTQHDEDAKDRPKKRMRVKTTPAGPKEKKEKKDDPN